MHLQPPFLTQKYTFWAYDPRGECGWIEEEGKYMKKPRNIKHKLLDELVDLALTLLSLIVGIVIARIFGIELDWQSTDYELIILFGCVVLSAIFLIIRAIRTIVQRKKQSKEERHD